MSLTLQSLTNIFDFIEKSKDRRAENFPFFQTGTTVVSCYVVCWIIFVQKIGPFLMRSRKGYDLRPFMLLCNACNLTSCIVGFGIALYYTNFGLNAVKCIPMASKRDFEMQVQVTVAYFYFWKKLVDSLRLVIAIFRKKDGKYTPIHKLQQMVELLMTYTIFIYFPGGVFFTFGLLDAFVLMISSVYDVPRSVGTHFQKELWWGSHIQYLQFLKHSLLIIHGLYYFPAHCQAPIFMKSLLMFQNIVGITVLLIDRQRLIKKQKLKQ